MCEGLFDWIGELLYLEIRFGYADHYNKLRASFAPGKALEEYAKARFPDVTNSLTKLLPLFLHCEGSRVTMRKGSKSRFCRVQAQATLDFALDLVVKKEIKPAHIAILSPYKANVEYMNALLKRPVYAALKGMAPASTVDSYQGRESDIVLVTIGTVFPYPGPGFTNDPHRLNVLMTRQKAGLVLVGHIEYDARNRMGPGKGSTVRIIGEERKPHIIKAPVLRGLYDRFLQHNRVMRLPKPTKE
jgi:hypothetical protein